MKLTDIVFYTKDINKSKQFYLLLGLQIAQDKGEYVSFNTNSKVLLSINSADTPAKERAVGGGSVSFDVDNVKELANKLKKQQVEFYKDIFELPFGKMFSILDLDKNKIMFVQRS